MALHTLYKLPLLAGLASSVLMAVASGQERLTRVTSPGVYDRQTRQDPGDIYLQAYNLFNEAATLAQGKSYNAALKKGREAERLLALIVRDFPNWNSNLVNVRRRMLAENMAEYKKELARSTDPSASPGHLPNRVEISRSPSAYPIAPGDMYTTPANQPYDTVDRQTHQELARLQEEFRQLAEAYKELFAKQRETQKQLTAAQLDQKMYKDRYERLQKQMEEDRAAGNSYVDALSRKIADMESKCRASEAALHAAEARASELDSRLAETQASLEKVTSERDLLLRENEQLRAIVELNSPEKTKALLDQNLTLAEQLKTAQERVQELEAIQSGTSDENAVLAKQLDEARAEAARLRDEMNTLFDENAGYRKRISELTEQLNNLEADLAARAEQPQIDPALVEENKVLRGIIEKQRHTIAMQEESRKLLLETYKALKKDDPELMNVLKKLEEEGPQELTAAERKILEDVRNGASEKATDAVRRNLQIETLADLANQAFRKKRFVSAEQLYLTLYDIQPDHVAGLVNLGTILIYNNKSEEALGYLTRATRLAPDMAICHYLAGIAAYRMEQLPEAQKMFSRTVQLDPGNAEAFFYLANIEAISGRTEQALKHFAAAVKIKPELADAHYNMARLYAESSKIPEAARSYDRAIHNGAMPDPAFEQFLRRHPDNAKAPGADLVEIIKPESEARDLRLAAEPETAASTPSPEQQAQQPTADPEPLPDDFQDLVNKTSIAVNAAPSPSPAGAGHETPAELFGTIRMRTPVGTRALRLKRRPPVRLRTRGEEQIEPLHPASEKRRHQ